MKPKALLVFVSCMLTMLQTVTAQSSEFNYTYHSGNAYFSDIIPFGEQFILINPSSRGYVRLNSILFTDSSGNVVKDFKIASPDGALLLENGVLTPDNKIIFVGKSSGATVILKTDTSGNILFSKNLNYLKRYDATPVIRTFDNNYLITGTRNGNGSRPAVVKLNEDGDILWSHTIMVNGNYFTSDIIQCRDSSFVITGYNMSYGYFGSPDQAYPYVFKLSKDGAVLWFNSYNQHNYGVNLRILETHSEHYIVTSSNGNEDDFIMKLNPDGTIVSTMNTPMDWAVPLLEDSLGVIHYISRKAVFSLFDSLNIVTTQYFTTDSNLNFLNGYSIFNSESKYELTDAVIDADHDQIYLAGTAINARVIYPNIVSPAFVSMNLQGAANCSTYPLTAVFNSFNTTIDSVTSTTIDSAFSSASFVAYRLDADVFCQTSCADTCSCYGAVVPNWTYSIHGDTVAFSDASTNGTYYGWELSDGTYSFIQNPVHVYDTLLRRKITLAVSNPCQGSTRVTQIIGQCPDTISIIASKPSLRCVGDTVVLKSVPTTGQARFYKLYSNGEWGAISYLQASFIITEPGFYRTSEIFGDSACILTSNVIEVKADSQFFASGYPDTIKMCSNDSVILIPPLEIDSWYDPHDWSPGPGSPVTVKWFGEPHPGPYYMERHTQDGCVYFSDTILVYGIWQETFHWDYPQDTTLCYGDTLELVALPGTNYVWNTDDSTDAIFVHESGAYYVEFDSANGCKYYSDTIHVTALDSTEDCNVGISTHGNITLKIYPNPFNTLFTIEMPNAQNKLYDLTLFDVTGNRIFEIPAINESSITINTNRLPQGVYFIELKSGEHRYRAKIIAL